MGTLRDRLDERPSAARELLVVAVTVFTLCVAGSYYYVVRPTIESAIAESWQPNTCTMLDCGVVEKQQRDHSVYALDVLYEYPADGRTYRSERYSFFRHTASGEWGWARDQCARLRPGATTTCYIDPDDPAEAVLVRDLREFSVALAAVALILVTLSTLMLGAAFRARRKAWQQSLTGKHSGSIVMEPRGRGVDFAFALTGVLVAGAALLPALLALVRLWVQGTLTPALAGAVGFLAVVTALVALWMGRVVMTMIGPKLSLTIMSARLRPGGETPVRWTLAGRRESIRSLAVTLEGFEVVMREHDSLETHPLEPRRLLFLQDAAELAKGHATLVLPDRTMPSFESANNLIHYRLRIAADIAGWPDFDETVDVVVEPEVRA